jgi:hypothetical protein
MPPIVTLEYILDVPACTQREPSLFVLESTGQPALVVNQLAGAWRIKPPDLRPLADRAGSCRPASAPMARAGSPV